MRQVWQDGVPILAGCFHTETAGVFTCLSGRGGVDFFQLHRGLMTYMLKNLTRLALAVSLANTLAGRPVFGQAFTASLTGTVTDPNGALVPGATVTTKSTSTN